jgi:ferredoxin
MERSPIYQISKVQLLEGLARCLASYKIAASTQKQGQVLYDYISQATDICFLPVPTILPWKKFLYPQNETLLEYTADGKKVTPTIPSYPQILFGIHPCDIHGMEILDEAFADSEGDPNYMSRREKTLVLGLDCQKRCDKDSFCYKVNAQNASTGFDCMFYFQDENNFLVEIVSDKAHLLFEQYFKGLTKADKQMLVEVKARKAKEFSQYKPFKDLDQLPEIYDKNKAHPVWKEEGDRCLSCGSCIMVCPTCYCFDVADELTINLKKGQRLRRWDACMVSSFAVVAGGENFRPSADERLKHRINRKFNYLMKKHGQAVCVGCGRCVRACLADISPKTITEKITGEFEIERSE